MEVEGRPAKLDLKLSALRRVCLGDATRARTGVSHVFSTASPRGTAGARHTCRVRPSLSCEGGARPGSSAECSRVSLVGCNVWGTGSDHLQSHLRVERTTYMYTLHISLLSLRRAGAGSTSLSSTRHYSSLLIDHSLSDTHTILHGPSSTTLHLAFMDLREDTRQLGGEGVVTAGNGLGGGPRGCR